jgi:type 1 glutamine amidotransferase
MVNSDKNFSAHNKIQQKDIIFLGTASAIYHPMEEIEVRLTELLKPCNVVSSADTKILNTLQLSTCALCILYPEFEQPEFKDPETAALLSFVAQGGSLLVLHNGISVQLRSELSQLVGAKFTEHPPYEELPEIKYHLEQPSHPIFEGVLDFSLKDEAYQFEMDPFADKELLLSYFYEGNQYPAGWLRRYGKGRMLYLCCGHNVEGFKNPQFSQLLKNSAGWLMKREEGKKNV